MNQSEDLEHLRLLSIFHYVVAGLGALFALFPVIHLCIGIAFLVGAFDEAGHGNPPPRLMGLFFVIPALLIITVGEALAVCIAIAGRNLGRQTNYTFCLVVAAIECMMFPFGTVLGVFTILVLMRTSVKELFQATKSTELLPA